MRNLLYACRQEQDTCSLTLLIKHHRTCLDCSTTRVPLKNMLFKASACRIVQAVTACQNPLKAVSITRRIVILMIISCLEDACWLLAENNRVQQ